MVCFMCVGCVSRPCVVVRVHTSADISTRADERIEEMSGEIFLAALVLQIELCNTVR